MSNDWQSPLSSILTRTNDNLVTSSRSLASSGRSSTPLRGSSDRSLHFETPSKGKFGDDIKSPSSASGVASQSSESSLWYHQLASVRAEIDSLRKLYSKLHDDILFEFDARSSHVAKQVKEDALILLESNKLKLSGTDRKLQDALDSSIDYLKRQQSQHVELLNHMIEKVSKEHRQNYSVLEQLIQKCTERISSCQVNLDKNNVQYANVTEELKVIRRNVIKQVIDEIKGIIASDMDQIHLEYGSMVDKKLKELYSDVERLSSQTMGEVQQVQTKVFGDVDVRLESLEKFTKQYSMKDLELTDRVSALETVVAENIKKPQDYQMDLSELERKLTSQFSKDLSALRSTFSAEQAKLRKKNSDMEDLIISLQKREEESSSIAHSVMERVNDLKIKLNTLADDFNHLHDAHQTKNASHEVMISNIQNQITSLRQTCDSLTEQTPMTELKKMIKEKSKATMQKYATTLKNKLDTEISKVREDLNHYHSDMNQLRMNQEGRLEDLKVQLSCIEMKQSEMGSSFNNDSGRVNKQVLSSPIAGGGEAIKDVRSPTSNNSYGSRGRRFSTSNIAGTSPTRQTSLLRSSVPSFSELPVRFGDQSVSPDTVLIKSTQLQIQESRGEARPTDKWTINI